MNRIDSIRSRSLRNPSAWVPLVLAACLAACGGSSDADPGEESGPGNGQGQPQTESEAPASPGLPPAEDELPIDPNAGGSASGTSLNLFELLEQGQCEGGWIDDEGETPNCNAKFSGACFESAAAACQCAGCPDACTAGDEVGAEIACEGQYLPGSCDFLVFDICYDDQDAACQAAGCQAGACSILESYPARVRCD